VLHRNFTTFRVTNGGSPRVERLERDGVELLIVRFAPHSFRDSQWSLKQWNVLDGLKVNGAGHGFFEYQLRWPEGLDPKQVAAATFCSKPPPNDFMARTNPMPALRRAISCAAAAPTIPA
jgi:hypothetical protein